MDFKKFMNSVSQARETDVIRNMVGVRTSSMIFLAGGLPNPSCFPIREAHFTLSDGSDLHMDEEKMKIALQYQVSRGCPELIGSLRKLVETYHSPPNFHVPLEQGGTDLVVTPGSLEGIYLSVQMIVNKGDFVLMQSPTYGGVLSMMRPLGIKLLPIESDRDGLIPSSLLETLNRCKSLCESSPDISMPKLLYTVPNGSNPTGMSTTIERKREIYKIAHQFDFLILEDDAYYFLQFTSPRIPSYLSLDTDGRVIRFDSFSKIVSSGLRVGFVTGSGPFIERILLHSMTSIMHVATFNQLLISDLLIRWGLDGFEKHVTEIADFYRKRKDLAISAASRWLSDVAEWEEPHGGMFLWFKLKGFKDSRILIGEKGLKHGICMVPGCAFEMESNQPSPFVRVAYSLSTPEDVDRGFQILSELIKQELNGQPNGVEH